MHDFSKSVQDKSCVLVVYLSMKNAIEIGYKYMA